MGMSSNNKSSTEVKLPTWAEPTAKEILGRGQTLSDAPYQQYGGQRIASLNDAQYGALEGTANRALQGNSLMNASQGALEGMMSQGNPYGGMSNPYFEKQLNGALDDVKSRVNTQFGGNANAWGSSGHNEVLAQQLGNTAMQMRSQQYDRAADLYNQDQSFRLQAAGMAPQFAANDYNDLRALMGVGDAYRSYEQDLLNQSFSDWQDQQNHPYKQLDTLSSALQSATRGYQTSTASAPGSSALAGALGGGMAGAGLAGMFGQNQMAGAGLGALAGALG